MSRDNGSVDRVVSLWMGGGGRLQEERNRRLGEWVLVWGDRQLGVECKTVAVNMKPS